jgi:hypothetical protein
MKLLCQTQPQPKADKVRPCRRQLPGIAGLRVGWRARKLLRMVSSCDLFHLFGSGAKSGPVSCQGAFSTPCVLAEARVS